MNQDVFLSLHFHQNKDWNKQTSSLWLSPANSRYTSIKTRIETQRQAWCWCSGDYSRYTSIKTRIETWAVTGSTRSSSSSRYTSIKTRIETPTGSISSGDEPLLSLHFHQNKDWNPIRRHGQRKLRKNSRYTSIKTRIETPHFSVPSLCQKDSRYTSIKTRIETLIRVNIISIVLALATLPSKQGLKRNQRSRIIVVRQCPLATLPSKQGLKQILINNVPSLFTLSLHFHQNKDWNSKPIRPPKKTQKLSLHFHQNKDWNSKRWPRNPSISPPLATLPSKQGLKP